MGTGTDKDRYRNGDRRHSTHRQMGMNRDRRQVDTETDGQLGMGTDEDRYRNRDR